MPSYQSFLKSIKSEIKETDVSAVKALIDRAGARGYEKLTGSWPGN